MQPTTVRPAASRPVHRFVLRLAPWSLLLAALLVAAAAPAAAQSCPTLVWADEFEGSALDDTRWTPQTGDGCAEGICGWGNNELQTYKAENATVGGGLLTITAKEERVRNKAYTSARIRTLNKGEWFYGRFEARIRIPTGQGIWPAFWMLPTDEVYGGWPSSGEIDVMENIGSEPETVHGTIHYGDSPQTAQNTGASFRLYDGSVFHTDFHDFAIEKQQGVIRWFVDDVLYQELTPDDIAPANWPFDERFHFILNVAVGGNWPGSPDATTVFPQTMDVDWVRVWDGNFPHLAGPRRVAHQATGTVFSVGNAFSDSTFNWTVPAGATIVSGQGTSSITVDWGDTGGAVTVDLSSSCATEQLAIDVLVEPPYVREFAFENFDEPANVTFQSSTGTLTVVSNPDPSGVNTSATSGDYARNSAETFDTLFYDTSVITDAAAYSSEQKRFYMDVYTAAPTGTPILIQLEDSSLATSSNYPSGRHSRYQAETSVQNQWERLVFTYLDSPDASTPDGGVDDIVILFATNSSNGDTYVFDNFDSYAVDDGSGGGDPPPAATTMHVASIVEGTEGAGQGNKRGTATVTIVDDLGNPVADATVSGDFTGDFNESASGVTGSDGTVTLVTSGTAKGGVSFTFCVSGVTHASLTYDPASNVQSCS